MTDDQDIKHVLTLMSGPLPLLPSRSEGNNAVLKGIEEAKRRGLAAVYFANTGRGVLQIGIHRFHRHVIQVEILWDDAPPPGVRLGVTLPAGDAEPGPGGTEPHRRGRTRPTGREAYAAFMSRLTSVRAP